MSGVSSYSEMPPSAPLIRASYRLTIGLSSTVTLMVVNCARTRDRACSSSVESVPIRLASPISSAFTAQVMLPVDAGIQ